MPRQSLAPTRDTLGEWSVQLASPAESVAKEKRGRRWVWLRPQIWHECYTALGRSKRRKPRRGVGPVDSPTRWGAAPSKESHDIPAPLPTAGFSISLDQHY